MLYIVDGSGGELLFPNDRAYAEAMSRSFCRRMEKLFAGQYYRGPTLSGKETGDIAVRVFLDIKNDRALGRQPLFLAGHSRGGAAVIEVARRLRQDGTKIAGMFLFDAVDRTSTVANVELVPRNVAVVYHALRDPSISTYFSHSVNIAEKNYATCLRHKPAGLCYEQFAILDAATAEDIEMRVRMRSTNMVQMGSIDFSNCGTGIEGPCTIEEGNSQCSYTEEKFLGSHGAIGGVPRLDHDNTIRTWDNAGLKWSYATERHKRSYDTILMQDRAAVSSVWSWMNEAFAKTGLATHAGMITPHFQKSASRQ